MCSYVIVLLSRKSWEIDQFSLVRGGADLILRLECNEVRIRCIATWRSQVEGDISTFLLQYFTWPKFLFCNNGADITHPIMSYSPSNRVSSFQFNFACTISPSHRISTFRSAARPRPSPSVRMTIRLSGSLQLSLRLCVYHLAKSPHLHVPLRSSSASQSVRACVWPFV